MNLKDYEKQISKRALEIRKSTIKYIEKNLKANPPKDKFEDINSTYSSAMHYYSEEIAACQIALEYLQMQIIDGTKTKAIKVKPSEIH